MQLTSLLYQMSFEVYLISVSDIDLTGRCLGIHESMPVNTDLMPYCPSMSHTVKISNGKWRQEQEVGVLDMRWL